MNKKHPTSTKVPPSHQKTGNIVEVRADAWMRGMVTVAQGAR